MEKIPRPTKLPGYTEYIVVGCGKIYITVNVLNGEAFEVFARLGKAGNCPTCQTEALTRSISMGLRHGVPIQEYVEQLFGIQCEHPIFIPAKVLSCPDAIAQVLKRYSKVAAEPVIVVVSSDESVGPESPEASINSVEEFPRPINPEDQKVGNDT